MSPCRCAFLLVALGGAALDVLLKSLAFRNPGAPRTLVPGLLSLERSFNTGGPWGILSSPAWAVAAVAALPLIATVYFRLGNPGRGGTAAFGLILAGALGNAWDRLWLGGVRDFIRLGPIPNFNLADAMLASGAALLFLLRMRHDRRPVGEAGAAHAGQPPDGRLGDLGRDHGPRP